MQPWVVDSRRRVERLSVQPSGKRNGQNSFFAVKTDMRLHMQTHVGLDAGT